MRPTAPRLTLLGGILVLALPAAATAQYRHETLTLPGKQIRFLVHDKLAAVPLRLGEEMPHRVAHFQPEDAGDWIHGPLGVYQWDLYVFEFESAAARRARESAPTTGHGGDAAPKSKEEARQEARQELFDSRFRAANFTQFVKEKDPSISGTRRFIIEGKERKGSRKRPGYSWWEYFDVQKVHHGGREHDLIWYRIATAYDLGDRQIALVLVVPVTSGDKPDSKYFKIARRSLTSLEFEEVEAADAEVDEDRDAYADTKERKEALARLKANIGDLQNWDYFTSPNYLFTYSWQQGDHTSKREMWKFAREMEARLEEIREKFVELYPPHDKVGDAYSVIRVCQSMDEFMKYGNTPPGVVGWFSPGSKELVIFYDKTRQILDSEDEMLSVCFHEAWHQYSDQYWPGVELHRWFDEGLAEYFGSLRKKGNRWVHQYHRGRMQSLNKQMNEKSLIPSAEIVNWHKDKFYGPRQADHYAQGWAMVDFLVRGEDVLGGRWNDRWSEILPIYAKVCLDEKSEKKAVEAAFEGVEWAAFEEAWQDWVDEGHIKRD